MRCASRSMREVCMHEVMERSAACRHCKRSAVLHALLYSLGACMGHPGKAQGAQQQRLAGVLSVRPLLQIDECSRM
jgi:hypothetical protein